jgi:hypothetical protein
LTGDGPTILLNIADDQPSSAELRVRLQEWVKGDDVGVWWDGTRLANPDLRFLDPHGISDVSSAVWIRFALGEVAPGPHEVKVVLIERHPQLACDLILTDVELVIRHD